MEMFRMIGESDWRGFLVFCERGIEEMFERVVEL